VDVTERCKAVVDAAKAPKGALDGSIPGVASCCAGPAVAAMAALPGGVGLPGGGGSAAALAWQVRFRIHPRRPCKREGTLDCSIPGFATCRAGPAVAALASQVLFCTHSLILKGFGLLEPAGPGLPFRTRVDSENQGRKVGR